MDGKKLAVVVAFVVAFTLWLLLWLKVQSLQRALSTESARLRAMLEPLRGQMETLPRHVVAHLNRTLADPAPDRAPVVGTYSPVSAASMKRPPFAPTAVAMELIPLLEAFLAEAQHIEPVGGMVRLRLDAVARAAKCSVEEVRAVLGRANTAFAHSQHEALRRQNFLSVLESRSEHHGESPFVAAISVEALHALRDHLPA